MLTQKEALDLIGRNCHRCRKRYIGRGKFCSRKCSNQFYRPIVSRRHRLAKYGITEDDYNKMLENQGGVCAICKNPPKKRRLAVDHDHKSGRVRGLLCYSCNYTLGFWHDNPKRFERAAEYLRAIQPTQ